MPKIVRNRLLSRDKKGYQARDQESFSDESKNQRAADLTLLFNAFRHTFDESYVRHVWQKNRHLMSDKSAANPFLGRSGGSHSSQDRGSSAMAPQAVTYIASGLVFSAWRVRTSLSTSSGHRYPPMDLVLKIPHPQSHERLAPSFRMWRSLLQRCPSSLVLLPPITLLECDDGFGLIMPFAESTLSQALPHWQPLAQRLREFEDGLATVGLVLRDPLLHKEAGARLQAGCWSGIPFIYDLSELAPTPSTP